MIWRLMVPPLSQKVANFYQLRSSVGFVLTFEPILRAGFFDKVLALLKKENPPLSLFLAF